MQKYVAFLRGINISGKNKISMLSLRELFDELKFTEVMTYINSGNVIFSSQISDKAKLIDIIMIAINKRFALNIHVLVITIEELKNILDHAPIWWGTENKEIYDNAIFVITNTGTENVIKNVGQAKEGYEFIESYMNVIFWSAYIKTFSKSNWSKIASSNVNNMVTIRNANTLKAILKMANV